MLTREGGVTMRIGLLLLCVLGLAACAAEEEPLPEPEKLKFARLSENPVEHGKRIAHVLGCDGCHTADFSGQDWSDPELGTLWTANLTKSAAKHSDDELLAMITTGRRPDRALLDMPSHLFTQVHEDDLRAVLAYLRSMPEVGEVHPEPTFEPKLAEKMKSGEYRDSAQEIAYAGDDWPRDLGPQYAMGRHIVRATCAECHGTDLRGEEDVLTGGPRSADLRIVAAYDPKDFETLLTTGKAAGNRELGLMSKVARNRFPHLTPDERSAVREYLVKLAEVDP